MVLNGIKLSSSNGLLSTSLKLVFGNQHIPTPQVYHWLFFLIFVLQLLILLIQKSFLQGILIPTQISFFVNLISVRFISWCLLLHRLSHFKNTAFAFTLLKYRCDFWPIVPINFPVRNLKSVLGLKFKVTEMFVSTIFFQFQDLKIKHKRKVWYNIVVLHFSNK